MTTNNSTLDFTSLLTDNRRSADDFVNATEWCKRFGKSWAMFDRLVETKAFVRAYCDKRQVPKKHLVHTVKGSGTFIHPVLAIKLAEWLSPEFDVFVKETFKAFIENPEDFAAEILIKSHNKGRVDRAKNRLLCSDTNKQTAEIAHKAGLNIGKVHNDRYNGLYRKTASQMRVEAGIGKDETPLDSMSSRDLQMNGLANTLTLESGDADMLFDFANDIRESYERRMKKPLVPCFEEKKLRPNQAKAIAYRSDYQAELPV
jgi:hypothetical protein